ncbi:proteasome subunit beta type-6-like [Coregonus clupeaformis]|uniref:proteasome subunit beta type-6-like n=1 Tax=Coregonus clupeaformis TaxID=59861 RepID=UPI001E1C2DBF|nr:proteasome subunit beta type-6-like [Coregonus clupeaformis]
MAAATAMRFGQLSSGIDMAPDWTMKEVSTGTTIMAVEYDGGVVIGADSRTTTGAYIANRVTDKLTPIHDRIFCCRYTAGVPQVYTVPLGGMLVRQPLSVGGSGSTYIYGYMDSNYQPNMTKDQGLLLVSGALSLAMERDGSSGGVVRLAAISETGVDRRVILGNQLPKWSTA